MSDVIITLIRCRDRREKHGCDFLQWCAVDGGTELITNETQILHNSSEQEKVVAWAVVTGRSYRIAQVPVGFEDDTNVEADRLRAILRDTLVIAVQERNEGRTQPLRMSSQFAFIARELGIEDVEALANEKVRIR